MPQASPWPSVATSFPAAGSIPLLCCEDLRLPEHPPPALLPHLVPERLGPVVTIVAGPSSFDGT